MDEREDAGSHWRRKVSIEATEMGPVTGWLLEPETKGQDQVAALIASPGHYEFGKDTIAGHPDAAPELTQKPDADYGKRAVEAGYIVFVPDWWGWGDRGGHLDKVGNRDKCNVIQMAASMYGISILNLHILESQAILDFLSGLPEVDSARLGVIGNSYGGRTAMWIAALDQRIKCVVSAGAANLFRERAKVLSSCAIQFLPGLLEFGDAGEVYSLIAPRPLMIQAGTKDFLINEQDRDSIINTVLKAYNAANASGQFEPFIFEGGHEFNWPAAESFLRKHLPPTGEAS
jgi:dienelactone hydrolase